MRSRTRNTIGAHLALLLMSHGIALGCSPGAGVPATEDRETAGKGDVHGPAALADVACTSSFDCPLDRMCNEGGQCVPWDDIEFGEASPMHLRISPDEPETVECSAWVQPSSWDYEHYDYLDALRQTGRVLYGDEQEDGLHMRQLRSTQSVLHDPELGRGTAEQARSVVQSLRDARDAARAARARYEARTEEAAAADERMRTALTFRPHEGEQEALEYLRGLYDLGVRVVASRNGAWVPHPSYEEYGMDFEPALDGDGRSEDGLYYVDEAELRHVLRPRDGSSHYRGGSRLFQARSTIAIDAAWLRQTSEALELMTASTLEHEVPSQGGTLEDYLDGSIEGFRLAYADVVNADIQRTGIVAEEFRELDSYDALWAFASDYPELRARTLSQYPELFAADCELSKASPDTLLGTAYGLFATGLMAVTGVALWTGGGFAVGAAVTLASLMLSAVITVTALGTVAVLWYLDDSATLDAAPGWQDRLLSFSLYGPVLEAIARGQLSLGQAVRLLEAAHEDESPARCPDSVPADELAEVCA